MIYVLLRASHTSCKVPEELHKLHMDAQLTKLPRWSGFPPEYSGLSFVEPNSDFYTTLGQSFIQLQTEMFGTDHLYAVTCSCFASSHQHCQKVVAIRHMGLKPS